MAPPHPLEQVIRKLTHWLLTARDDLIAEEEAREYWAAAFDGMLKYDLRITKVEIAPVPRNPATWPSESPTAATWRDVCYPFGKYAGRPFGELADKEPGFIKWAGQNVVMRNQKFADALKAAVEAVQANEKAQ